MYTNVRKIIIIIIALILFIQPSIFISLASKEASNIKSQIQIKTDNHPNIIEMIESVNNTILESYIQEIEKFGPHPTGSDSIVDVEEYLFNELSSMNVSVKKDSWVNKKYSGNNIVATQTGKQDSGIIIVCAHYDTVTISPGSDDDGSGVASVLMMAKIMSEYSFNATIKFILFSGEELGLLGSLSYAEKAKENDENIIGVLALDKIGYAKKFKDGKIIRHHADSNSEWMIDIGEDISKKYFNEIGLELTKYPFDPSSDHRAFVENGFCGSNLVENALNPNYHTSEDLLEHMNISYLSKVCKLSVGIISTIAHINPKTNNDDIKINIKGTRLSKICQLSINIENKNYMQDTANVSINISMKHIFRNSYVSLIKDFYNATCSWNYTKEIYENWEFQITNRRYSRGLFKLEVSVQGFDDDLNIRSYKKTHGIIINQLKIILIPKF